MALMLAPLFCPIAVTRIIGRKACVSSALFHEQEDTHGQVVCVTADFYASPEHRSLQ